MIMNAGEFVILLLFLAVLLFIPILIIQFIGSRKPASKPGLQECPNCGAENHRAKQQCYCCGHPLHSSPLESVNAPLIERVKQADASRAKRSVANQTPGVTADKPLPSGSVMEE